MAQPRLKRIQNILNKLKEKGDFVTIEELKEAIALNIGSDNRTMKAVELDIERFKMLEVTPNGLRINK